MRFSLRRSLLGIAIIAILVLPLRNLYQHATYLPLHVCESAWTVDYKGPYIHCKAAHDPDWGRVRMIFLQRIGTEQAWKERRYLPWLDCQFNHQFGTRIFASGRLVVPCESVLVYYADGDSSPQYAEFELDEIPLRDPWWPDAEKLWEKLHSHQSVGVQTN